jgi:hypothetical protein
MINVKHFLSIENFAQSSILFEFKGDFFSINPGNFARVLSASLLEFQKKHDIGNAI